MWPTGKHGVQRAPSPLGQVANGFTCSMPKRREANVVSWFSVVDIQNLKLLENNYRATVVCGFDVPPQYQTDEVGEAVVKAFPEPLDVDNLVHLRKKIKGEIANAVKEATILTEKVK